MIQFSNSSNKYAIFVQLGFLLIIAGLFGGGYIAILHYKILFDERHSFLKIAAYSAIVPVLFIWPVHIFIKSLPSGLSRKNENTRLRQFRFFFFLLGLFIMSQGAVTTLNAVMDKSPVHNYKVKVLSKRIRGGRHTSYELTVRSWSGDTREIKINLSHSEYDSMDVRKDDYVNIGIRNGALGFNWISSITKAGDST